MKGDPISARDLVMTLLLTLLALGCVIGYGIRGKTRIVLLERKLTNISIYALLFLLGVSVANIPGIFDNFMSLGIPALTLSISGVLGSCICSSLANRWITLDR